MRDLDPKQDTALGQKVVKPTPTPQRKPEPTARPGVFRGVDGRLFTDVPQNEAAK